MANTLITHIHIYTGTVTKGDTDGILVSEADYSRPLIIGPLNIATSELSAPVKCAIRCNDGVKTYGKTYLTLNGANATNWELALDNAKSDPTDQADPLLWQPWGGPLVITDEIGDRNYIFWIRSRAVNSDTPGKDRSTSIEINANLYGD